MKTLWPRTEPLLAEAHKPPPTVRRSAWPVATASCDIRPPATAARTALAVTLLAGWLGVCWRRGGGSRRSQSGVRHVSKFRQIVPGAVCAQHHSTQRLPLSSRGAASAAGRRRAGPARVHEERSHVRRERSGGPPGFRRAGCLGATGAGRGRAGPKRGRRGRCRRPQAATPRFAGRPQSSPPGVIHPLDL
jgi:hypothetical protein